jgi:hypothetical protein
MSADRLVQSRIAYGQASAYPTGAQNEVVPADDAVSESPDAAGDYGVYFVSDHADNLSVYQVIHLDPGSYDIGFDSYDTYNGAVQTCDANLTARIANVTLADFNRSSVQPGQWSAHTGEAKITTAGDYLVSFVFDTDQFPARTWSSTGCSSWGTPMAAAPSSHRRAPRNRPAGP